MKRTIKKNVVRRSSRGLRARNFNARSACFFAAALGLWLPKSYSAVLVDLDATGLPTGALPTWSNDGTLDDFVAPGGAVPSVEEIQGAKGVTFDGTNH